MSRITLYLDDATQALAGRFADFPLRDADGPSSVVAVVADVPRLEV